MFRFLWLAMLLQPALAFNVGGALAPPTTAATYPLATRSGAVVADAGIIDSIGGVLQSKEVHDLGIFFAQTVISWGVPATVVGALALLVFKPSGGPNEPPPLPPALAKALGVDGGPKEYLEIEKLNEKLQSFEYSFAKNSLSEASAKRSRGKQEIERQLGAEFQSFGLDTATVEKVYDAAKKYRKAEEQVTKKIELSLIELRTTGLARKDAKGETKDDAAPADEADATEEGGFLSNLPSLPKMGGGGGDKASTERIKSIAKLQQSRLELELDFLAKLSAILTADQAKALADVLKPSSPATGAGPAAMMGGGASPDNPSGMPRLGGRLDALAALVTAAGEAAGRQKQVYVLKFFGDVTASQVSQLRQEVTAVLRSADVAERGDEVVLVLNTGGGTVTGYGLAAAQLARIKEAGLPLTICVEQVAASGGYMMACVADTLIASPFAVLGSIGVITEQPNVYERLKKEGVEFNTVTAGKYKRTLTPTKKVDPLDVKKLEEDIAQILVLFKNWVGTNRPQMDIEEIATGETWFGPDALERNMVDHLKTVDDVLLGYVDAGAEVMGVTYKEKPKSPLAALGVGGEAAAAIAATSPLQALAVMLMANALGGNGSNGGGVAGGLAELLKRQGGSAGMLQRSAEGEYLAARPSDEAEPMLLFGDEQVGGAQQKDSWFL